MTNLLILTPFIGILNCLNIVKKLNLKKMGFFFTIISLIITIVMWNKYNYSYNNPQFIIKTTKIIIYGIDSISLLFLLLTTFIIGLSIISSWKINSNIKYFILSLLSLENFLILIFIILDILIFYIFFETSLIPMFLLIGLFGSDIQGYKSGKKIELIRIFASYQFFLMTFAGSLLMLMAILTLYSFSGTYDYIFMVTSSLSLNNQYLLWLGFFTSFAVKTPLFPFHQWLPLAHTEAPLSGSIILAGILLKLATYGFLRFSFNLYPDGSFFFIPLILILSLLGILYSSLTTIRQIDFKKIIAYSSIGHMAIVIISLFSFSFQGLSGAIFLSIAHGLTSPGLFICVTALYDRYHSRTLLYYKGLIYFTPIFAIIFFYFILSNMATPLTSNFIGELLSFIGIFFIDPTIGILSSFSIILVASYSIWFFNRILFGSYSLYLKLKIEDFNKREFSITYPLLIIIFITAITPFLITDIFEYDISFILLKNLFNLSSEINFCYMILPLLIKKNYFINKNINLSLYYNQHRSVKRIAQPEGHFSQSFHPDDRFLNPEFINRLESPETDFNYSILKFLKKEKGDQIIELIMDSFKDSLNKINNIPHELKEIYLNNFNILLKNNFFLNNKDSYEDILKKIYRDLENLSKNYDNDNLAQFLDENNIQNINEILKKTIENFNNEDCYEIMKDFSIKKSIREIQNNEEMLIEKKKNIDNFPEFSDEIKEDIKTFLLQLFDLI